MFNLKRAKKQSKAIEPFDKSLEKNRKAYDATANDNPTSYTGLLDRKDKDVSVPTEAQFDRKQASDNQITEKNFEHEKIGELYMPSINAFVEDMIQERRKEFTEAQTKNDPDHWTLKPSTQNKSLPAWPKITSQHDKKVLPNSINRKTDEPILGGKVVTASAGRKITAGSLDNLVTSIKNGDTNKYDTKIVEILKIADNENRELTISERKQISEFKKQRTHEFLGV